MGATNSHSDSASAVSGYSSDDSSGRSDCEVRHVAPPSFLPVKSCFESDDDESGSTDYQRLLEDVTAFDFHALPVAKSLPEISQKIVPKYHTSKTLENFELEFDEIFDSDNNVTQKHVADKFLRKTNEDIELESEAIISPYSPNKIYFYLVHMDDEMMTS